MVLAAAPLAIGAAMPAPSATPSAAPDLPLIDRIVVHKAARVMELWASGRVVRVISGLQLGPSPVGAKHFQGDGRTPEGHYIIDYGNGASSYDFSLHFSYPNADDRAYAAAHGRAPGGDVFIHGQPNGARASGDWTAGCIALGNGDIETLWQVVGDGTPIDITP